EFRNKQTHLRKNRNGKSNVSFVPVNDDARRIKIDISSRDRRGLSLSKSRQSDEFDEIARFLSLAVERLRANVGNDSFELFKRWCQPNRFFALAILETSGGIFHDDVIVDGLLKGIAN